MELVDNKSAAVIIDLENINVCLLANCFINNSCLTIYSRRYNQET